MIKALIFDLDGTLADTIDDIGWAVNKMLAARGFPTLTRADHLANINNGAFQLIKRSVPKEYRENEPFVKECLSEYEREYSTHYAIDTKAYDGAKEALLRLANKGCRLAVLSNKQDGYVKKIIDTLFPEVPFEEVMGQTELPTKPDPTVPLIIAKNLGVLPRETAFVGDSQVDIKTALNAGMRPVGVAWGYRSTELLIREGAELIIDTPPRISDITELIRSEKNKDKETF